MASLFELVKSEKPVYIRNNYAYEKDDVATIKTKADTVAYYTYAIKWINPELDKVYYLKDDLSLDEALNDDPENADQFIIKENKDVLFISLRMINWLMTAKLLFAMITEMWPSMRFLI